MKSPLKKHSRIRGGRIRFRKMDRSVTIYSVIVCEKLARTEFAFFALESNSLGGTGEKILQKPRK